MIKQVNNRIIWVSIFAIAMGFLETAVVVYLRKIYYPAGFSFPLNPIDLDIGLTEIFREIATIIMLLGIGITNGNRPSSKFAFFIYAFAIWDIFYYIFLKLILDWPASILSWDILFLIPAPWVGPVIAPCIISFLMILFAVSILYLGKERPSSKISLREWIIFISGSSVVIYSFVMDYYNVKTTVSKSESAILNDFTNYIPQTFHWSIFLVGIGILIVGITAYTLRQINNRSKL